jgi:nicotinamidase-related amidase
MTSAPVRDPLADHLITPENAAFLFIDYQPAQLATIRSMDPALLVKNAVSTVRTIKTFGVPVVHSTVNVASVQGQPTLPELAGLLAEASRAGLDRVIQAGRRRASDHAEWQAVTTKERCGGSHV